MQGGAHMTSPPMFVHPGLLHWVRSLADRWVWHRLPVKGSTGLLNDPSHPYWGHYKGDEDTRRKPAYHNGTAWTWPFPSFAEALFMTHGEAARSKANALLSSSAALFNHGCIGHLPEILDGDAPPHTTRLRCAGLGGDGALPGSSVAR